MTDRSCSDELFEEIEEIEDMDVYDNERYFPYKRPVLPDSELVSSSIRHRSEWLVSYLGITCYKKNSPSVKKRTRKRVLLSWNLDQARKKGGNWDGKP